MLAYKNKRDVAQEQLPLKIFRIGRGCSEEMDKVIV